ncbi:MAG: PhoU family transcriptional regulator [Thermoplasmata archaeon]|nr:MAG: PhoU family transcriptional regulator [Thermoplasmata archaeon]
MVLEMKDTTELMIDLAYSSLIYNNQEIAEEVSHLNEVVSSLSLELRRMAVGRLSRKNTDLALILVELSYSLQRVADAAMEIADVVLRGLPLHPILRRSIQEGEVGIYRAKVSPKSKLAGKTLGEVELASETGIWVFAIKRGKKWIYGPDENTRIKEGDILFVRAPDESRKLFLKLCSGKKKL